MGDALDSTVVAGVIGAKPFSLPSAVTTTVSSIPLSTTPPYDADVVVASAAFDGASATTALSKAVRQ